MQIYNDNRNQKLNLNLLKEEGKVKQFLKLQ